MPELAPEVTPTFLGQISIVSSDVFGASGDNTRSMWLLMQQLPNARAGINSGSTHRIVSVGGEGMAVSVQVFMKSPFHLAGLWAVDLVKSSDVIVVWFSVCDPEIQTNILMLFEGIKVACSHFGKDLPRIIAAGCLTPSTVSTDPERPRHSAEYLIDATSCLGGPYVEVDVQSAASCARLLHAAVALVSTPLTNHPLAIFAASGLSELSIDRDSMSSLKRHTDVTLLCYSHNTLSVSDGNIIGEAVKANPSLTQLTINCTDPVVNLS